MAEPQLAVVGGTIGFLAGILGGHVDAFVLGLMSAIFVSVWIDTIDNKVKVASACLLSSMLAGYGSPFAASWASGQLTSLAGNADGLRLLMAVLIGAAAPTIIPLAMRYAKRRVEQ